MLNLNYAMLRYRLTFSFYLSKSMLSVYQQLSVIDKMFLTEYAIDYRRLDVTLSAMNESV